MEKVFVTCQGCEFYHSDSWYDTYWFICTHPDWGEDGQILPTRDGNTPDWCPLNEGYEEDHG